MARPRPAGRSLEARGNAGPREMVATVFDGTEPGVQTDLSVLASPAFVLPHSSNEQVPTGCARALVCAPAVLGPVFADNPERSSRSPAPRVFVRTRRLPGQVRDELVAQEWGSWIVAGGGAVVIGRAFQGGRAQAGDHQVQ